ncbi:hypothetical protein [Streptomyces spinosisporus]|uniref:Uncharacterized protein n=1 Tax=Streptomyces spinosisporus TaxID=2927582 RepID=A0ABS9XWM7_9ACTN|nr:hypothetical protein [Streptomyces spinosisporus]MCI3246483.1 hypothetical protein [Streptomyces spinosisporus]
MTTPQEAATTRRNAMELTLHRLTNTQPGAIHSEITRLCNGGGIEPLAAMTIHLADAMAAVLIKDTGSREDAITALRQQLGTT